jgi:DNA polymerase-3 subunit delta
MQARPERLPGLLARQPLPPIFLVFGEEPLQRIESVDALRAAARGAGLEERIVFDAAIGIEWPRVLAEAGSLSLFASRRLIEIHLGAKKPDRQAAAALVALAAQRGDDVFVVTAETLRGEDQGSEWFRALDARGVVVPCRALELSALRAWLAQRAAARGLELADDAVEVLALRAEGNLLAAAQEIDKLALIVDSPAVDAAQVLAAVADSSRYDPFKLVDAAVGGDSVRTLRILRGLRAEGSEPVMLGWAVNRELRLLARLAMNERGPDAGFAAERVRPFRQPLLRRALQRLTPAAINALLRDSVRVDLMLKGATQGQPWDALESLYLALAGGPWFGELAADQPRQTPAG